jgi:hypothetical protein
MNLLIQKVADKMGEKRGAGQSSRILSQGLDPYEGGPVTSIGELETILSTPSYLLLKISKRKQEKTGR